ncbi:MAG: hypothetical protein SFU99_00340 [Saprospiraceae bacterium]|nr:hypothetical protein [Saprospiraceae bacterium]
MKQFLILLIGFTFWCCGNQQSSEQKPETPINATESNTSGQATPVSANSASEELTIYFPNLSSKTGDQVCVDVLVKGFEQLLSMQYTLAWNKAILKFREIKNFNLPYLDAADFGQHRTADGFITAIWLDETLKGVSVPDATSIYQICFDVIGKSGDNSFIKITDRPTPTEVANSREKLIPMKKENGSVKVE